MKTYLLNSVVAVTLATTFPALATSTNSNGSRTGTTASGSTSGTTTVGTSTNTSINKNAGINTTANTNANGAMRWDTENTYWRENFTSRPYYSATRKYNVYEPAYRYGYDTFNRNTNTRYDDLNQEELRKGWEQARGNSTLSWEGAQDATRDSYTRMYENRSTTTR